MLVVFYVAVLALAFGGQVHGLHDKGAPWPVAFLAATVVELAGVVVFQHAAARRRLGERATAALAVAVLVTAWSVTINYVGHDHIWGPVLAGSSLLGFIIWVLVSEASRRDALRKARKLPPTPPAYELVGHWMAHPLLTLRARAIAKARPALGVYGSLDAAREAVRVERRQRALTRVLNARVKKQLGADHARLVAATYDMEQIAGRLRERADYDGYAAIIGGELTPTRIASPDSARPGEARRLDALPRLDVGEAIRVGQEAMQAVSQAAESDHPDAIRQAIRADGELHRAVESPNQGSDSGGGDALIQQVSPPSQARIATTVNRIGSPALRLAPPPDDSHRGDASGEPPQPNLSDGELIRLICSAVRRAIESGALIRADGAVMQRPAVALIRTAAGVKVGQRRAVRIVEAIRDSRESTEAGSAEPDQGTTDTEEEASA